MKKELSKNDFYTKKAKEYGYPGRSVYKLKELDEKFGLFKPGDKVLDLGASPGSWLLYVARMIGPKGQAVGVDAQELKIALPQNCSFRQKSVFDFVSFYDDRSKVKQKFQVVVSDLAPKTTGIKEKDAADSLVLAKQAFTIAKKVLVEKGDFVCKVFESQPANEFLDELKKTFSLVRRCRPKAVLKQSREFYIVAKGLKKHW